MSDLPATSRNAGNDLCWFCAARPAPDALHVGSCLGAMVYGTHMSLPPDLDDDELTNRARNHREDRAQICTDCLVSFGGKCRLAPDYMERMAANSDDTHFEMLDYDVGMVDTEVRTHRFGCWFDLCCDEGVECKFWSRTFLELFANGLRFVGGIPLRATELSYFIRAFALRPDDPRCHANEHLEAAFAAHIAERFTTDSPMLLVRLAGVRACIFDISAVKLMESMKTRK